MIEAKDLHITDRQMTAATGTLSIEDVEKEHIEKVLKIFAGNRKKTAEALGISEKGLYLKIKEYGISAD
jgi:DNA-binding NtrC family response regulator